ncbi:MAG TPA: HupE/UreJ family protein [Porticoccus sp.]|nr:HupE/UreJ family protein [Porticoccus sp.]
MKALITGLVLILLINISPNIYGHEGRPVYIEITQTATTDYQLRWKIPPVMTAQHEPRINIIGDDCSIYSGQNSAGLVGRKSFRCMGGHAISVDISYPGANPALSSLIVLRRLDGESIELFNAPEKTQIILPQEITPLQVAQQYLLGGAKHILVGFDHLLFITCLLFIAGGTKRVLITITGFTLAHSITLALASLNIVRISAPLVEVLIALSIAVLAAEIIKQKTHTWAWRFPLSSACVFGLLHGFGFASVLADLGLPYDMKINALIFFNVGVELGQIIFIVAVISAVKILKQMTWVQAYLGRASTVSVFTIGSISMYWLVGRSLVIIG